MSAEQSFDEWFMDKTGLPDEKIESHPSYTISREAWTLAWHKGWDEGENTGWKDADCDGYNEGRRY